MPKCSQLFVDDSTVSMAQSRYGFAESTSSLRAGLRTWPYGNNVLAYCGISSLVITNAALANSPLICYVYIAFTVSSGPRYTSLPNMNGHGWRGITVFLRQHTQAGNLNMLERRGVKRPSCLDLRATQDKVV